MKNKKDNKKTIVKEKLFCPICGSDKIRKISIGRYSCLNCRAIFSFPRKTKIKLRKKPRYIG